MAGEQKQNEGTLTLFDTSENRSEKISIWSIILFLFFYFHLLTSPEQQSIENVKHGSIFISA